MSIPKIILDSGAYTVWRQGKSIDIEKYMQFYKENEQFFNGGCFNLDVILDAKNSYKNWRYIKNSGVDAIPVYHIGTSEKWLKRYMNHTDHIALGAVANLSSVQRRHGLDYIFKKYLTDEKGKPIVKVHGLGITAMNLIIQYPWYSVDSFTPLLSSVFGSIFLPGIKNGKWDLLNGFLCKISSQGSYIGKSSTSFLGIASGIKKRYEKLIKEHGFSIGQITYVKKNKTRKEKKKKAYSQELPSFFDLDKQNDVEEITLANNQQERLRWNLLMWNKLKEQLPNPCIIYLGSSTVTSTETFGKVYPKHDMLISYAYIEQKFFDSVKQYKTQ